MKYLKSYLESDIDKLYKQVGRNEFDEYFIGRKEVNISRKEYLSIKSIFDTDQLLSVINRGGGKYLEIIFESSDGDESQILIFKYDDDWFSIQVHISNGPSYYYISDSIDGIHDFKKNESGMLYSW